MPLEIRQLHDLFGAELVGVNATKPLTEADFVPIRDAFETYSVLLFRGPVVTDDQQVALSEHFGHVQVAFQGEPDRGNGFRVKAISIL